MVSRLTNLAFLSASAIVILVFFASRTYIQLGIAVAIYSALVIVALMAFPRKTATTTKIDESKTALRIEKTHKDNKEIETVAVDINRRTFIKLLGATGISFFIFSILGRSVEALLFGKGSLTGGPISNGLNQFDNSSPTNGYKIAEIDEGENSYFGFTNYQGGWLIMKEDSTTSSYRYAKGDFNFSENWRKREKLNYDYFYNIYNN